MGGEHDENEERDRSDMPTSRKDRRNMTPPPLQDLPFEKSVGYQLRMANRATQRYLSAQIAPHGVTLGMWYFLRALWQEDGLTQRELSQRIGTMEPTTLAALNAMQKSGFVTRERDDTDRRKLNVRLTEKGHALKSVLLPRANHVVEQATVGLSVEEKAHFLHYLIIVQRNLASQSAESSEDV